MKTTLATIENILAAGKTFYSNLDQKLSSLTLAEKVLIGIVWAVIALISFIPDIFWIATLAAIIALAVRSYLRKKKEEEKAVDNTVVEEIATE